MRLDTDNGTYKEEQVAGMAGSSLESLVEPFVGERYAASERLSDFIAPPYDEISPERRKDLASRSSRNIVHLVLPEGNDDKYENAAHLLRSWRGQGVLKRDAQPGVYVVQQQFTLSGEQFRARTGVIGAVAVEPYSRGRIRPHVRTDAGARNDRLALLAATEAVFEALLMLKRDDGNELRTALSHVTTEQAVAQADLDDVHVGLWYVGGSRGEALSEIAGTGTLYLADGHHRYEAAVAYRKQKPDAKRTLGLIVPVDDPGLAILATHRVVYADGLDFEKVFGGLRDRFQIHELTPGLDYAGHLADLRDRGTACVVIEPDGTAVSLLLRPRAKLGNLPFANEPAAASLDVLRIDETVVRHLLSVAGKGAVLRYSADWDHVVNEVVRGTAVASVMLNPTAVEQVLGVADAGVVLPHKATCFIPKVPGGVVTLALSG
jgi:uncharacterized protein (DUF1015 family)